MSFLTAKCFLILFVPQGLDWIDAAGVSSWEPNCRKSNGAEKNRDCKKHQRVVDLDTEYKARDKAREPKSADQAQTDASKR